MLPAGHVVASRYEVLSPLGAGGMGAVYKVYDRAATDPEPPVRASALLALRALGRVEPAP